MIIDSHLHLDVYTTDHISPKQRLQNLKSFMELAEISKAIAIASIEENTHSILDQDALLDLIKDDKDIFIAASVPFKKHDTERLRTLLSHPKVVALKLYPGYENFLPSDESVFPFYGLCQEMGMPVIFHTGETFGNKAPAKCAHPLHIDEVALKFPELKIVMAHMGNPWIDDAMVVLNRHRNVFADISGLVWNGFDNYWKEHYTREIVKVIRWCDDNKLIFGTDWPCCNKDSYASFLKDYVEFAHSLPLGAADKRKLLFDNASRIFRKLEL